MKKHFRNGSIPGMMIAIIVAGLFFFAVRPVAAQLAGGATTVIGDIPRMTASVKETVLQAIVKAGRISFMNSLRSLVNQFAYDTATYIGSGGQGQKPVYFTENFGDWLKKQGANAGGAFIEEFARTDSGSFIDKYGICSPDLSVAIKISLGLTDFASDSGGLQESRCNLKKIYEAGENQIANYSKPGYLRDLAIASFDPQTTDVGAALTLFGQFTIDTNQTKEEKTLERQEGATGGAWIAPQSLISKRITAPPETNKNQLAQAAQLQTETFFTQTGDIFVDAANIFLNQLALSAFNKLISTLSVNQGNESSSANFYGQGGNGGIAGFNRKNSTILQARFNERSDYDILSQLSSCPNEGNPGPTNCVITQQFAQAISDQLTLSEAIAKGILDPNKRIGFDQNGNELNYKDGYPYRSLIILRKYRILPVSWEVAAQYIKDHPQYPDVKNITLGDLLACYEKDDSTYTGFYSPWCEGLVDPNWLLKVPKQFCGMEGYGPTILQQTVSPNNNGYCAQTSNNCTNPGAGCSTNNISCTSDGDCLNSDPSYPKCNFTVKQDIKVTRADGYCADEQSCIKENPNGTCAFYGYCTEERRLWNFSASSTNSCEPRNNTCQTFSGDSGKTVSFLQNTLDYGNCNANQVGCKQYALTGTYDAASKKVAWSNSANQAFFNKNITACEAAGEGCHQFIRAKDDLGTNLIADGSFEDSVCDTSQVNPGGESSLPLRTPVAANPFIKSAQAQSTGECRINSLSASGTLPAPNDRWYIRSNGGTVKAGIVNTWASDRSNSLYVEGNGGLYSKDNSAPSLLPVGFVMEGDSYYTLSATLYVETGTVRLGFGSQAGQYVDVSASTAWQPRSFRFYNPATAPLREFFIQGTDASAKFYIDQVQLVKGQAASTYSQYLSSNVIYQKLLPVYLESTCYQGTRGGDNESEFQLKPNAPAECYQFARKCAASEVGCEAYTSLDSGIAVTAKAKAKDACPQSCVGYDTFVQQENQFNAKKPAYFIPRTARSCSAVSVGCTAFTNLDKLSQGGEAVEYYSAMRSCMKPDALQCGQFYTWEGSDESGYQLKVFSLKKAEGRVGEEPASTLSADQEGQLCNAEIFKKLPSEPGYNYDCREFYAQDGTVSYHLYQRTISCSDDCHPYRREVASATECTAGGGTWDATQSRCLHYAIPSEGTTCSAQEVGCQEYTGNIANNTRDVFMTTFENGVDGWNNLVRPTVVSNTSLNLGGHSLSGSTFTRQVGDNVKRNLSYNISFLARAAGGTVNLTGLEFRNSAAQAAAFSTTAVSLTSEWKLYTFNLSSLDHDVTPSGQSSPETLAITFSGNVYIDNVKLTEVPARYYLIQNSWNTPAECDRDTAGASSPQYMLGCSQYRKADDSVVTLRSFSGLCQDSAAGCEAMIDTKNSDAYKQTTVNGIESPADSMINVVFDRTKQCNSGAKSCQRAGVASTYDGATTYSDVYIKNDPNQYNSIVCTSAGVGCSQWKIGSSDVYFKDPGDQICEWRLKQNSNNEYAWLKKQVRRCGGTTAGTLCNDNTICAQNQQCQLVAADEPCTVASPNSMPETLGTGGAGNRVAQPATWAATCEPAQSSCTEYIDPLSSANSNLVINPTYQATDGRHDPWVTSGSGASQTIGLQTHTTYILKGDMAHGNIPATAAWLQSCQNANIYELNPATNEFVQKASSTHVSGTDSAELYIVPTSSRLPSGGVSTSVSCTLMRGDQREGQTVQLRQAIVAYQLADNIDRSTPNGLVSPNKGYILFNERAQSGPVKKSLLYNVDATLYGTSGADKTASGVVPSSQGPLNSNVILKVQPDRTCSKWLACTTSIPDPNNPSKEQCLGVGLCDALDNDGNCKHFIDAPTANQTASTPGVDFANMTGYSKVGYKKLLETSAGTDSSAIVTSSIGGDYYNFATMRQDGETISSFKGGFETPSSSWSGDTYGNQVTRISIVNQPAELSRLNLNAFHNVALLQTKGGSLLPPVGNGIGVLKAPSSLEPPLARSSDSQAIALTPGKRYVVSAYMYIKSETSAARDAGVRVTWNNGQGSRSLLTTNSIPRNQWTRRSIGFVIDAGASNPRIEVYNQSEADFYIDDIVITASLNYRCDTSESNDISIDDCQAVDTMTRKPAYVGPTCRLYPREDAMSCEQTDSNGVTTKGVQGYCLETDPKNPDTCLLWYPIDRIESEGNDDQLPSPITESGDLYYCIEAQDRCQSSGTAGTRPQLFCKTFVKVNRDKYWYNRLTMGSNFSMSNTNGFFSGQSVFSAGVNNKMIVNLGNKYNYNNTHGILAFDSLGTNSLFGALIKSGDLGSSDFVDLDSSGNLRNTSFIPYYFDPYRYDTTETDGDGRIASNINRQVCWPPDNNPSVDIGAPGTGMLEQEDSAFIVAGSTVKQGETYNCYMSGNCTGNNYHWWIGRDPLHTAFKADTNGSGTEVKGSITRQSNMYQLQLNTAGQGDNPHVYFVSGWNIKDFNVASTISKGIEAIRRIFVSDYNGSNNSTWTAYSWNGSGYTQQNLDWLKAQPAYAPAFNRSMASCPLVNGVPTRPASYQNNGDDYCYVFPRISDFKIKNQSTLVSVFSNERVAITFNTTTDSMQLPIDKIEFFTDRSDATGQTLWSKVGDSNPRTANKSFQYWSIKSAYPNKCAGPGEAVAGTGMRCGPSDNCCIIKPSLKITDNWGYFDQEDFGGYVVVNEGQ